VSPVPRRINCSRDITLECFTREEFCVAHNVGRTMYYELRKAGKGPVEFRLGSKVLITRESAAAWRAARDAEAKSSRGARKDDGKPESVCNNGE
jgi:hypothetical protein